MARMGVPQGEGQPKELALELRLRIQALPVGLCARLGSCLGAGWKGWSGLGRCAEKLGEEKSLGLKVGGLEGGSRVF